MTTELTENLGPIGEAAALVERLNTPKVVPLKGRTEDGVQVLLTPEGMQAHSIKAFLDEYREKPERRQGTAVFTRLEGLIDHAQRFKDDNAALFALDDPKAPRLTSVLDYHPKGGDNTAARFGRHRGLYQFPLSPEWQAWSAMNGQAMRGQDFYEFLERHAIEIAPAGIVIPNDVARDSDDQVDGQDGFDLGTKRLRDMARLLGTNFAGPDTLMALAKGLKLRVNSEVEEQRDISTGEASLVFKTEHRSTDGVPLKVPNLFAIHIPVFTQGAVYLLGVRLRYRLDGGKVVWIYEMHRPDLAFTDAFDEACERARDATGLPLFYGNPE